MCARMYDACLGMSVGMCVFLCVDEHASDSLCRMRMQIVNHEKVTIHVRNNNFFFFSSFFLVPTLFKVQSVVHKVQNLIS